jgi:hypothetical protein
MNRKQLGTFFLLAILVACTGGVFASEDIINKNSGFETQLNNFPRDWYCVGLFSPEVKFSFDKDVKHSGAGSVSITVKEMSKRLKGFGPPNWAQDITKNVPAGKKVRLTAFLKAKDVQGIAPIGVQCWDREMKNIIAFGTTQYKDPVSGTTDWKKVSFELDVPQNTAKIRILCMLSGTGTIWIDDVKLETVK